MYRCPVCQKDISDDLRVFVDHVEADIGDLIKKDHPDWADKNGMCPKCLEYYKQQLKGEDF